MFLLLYIYITENTFSSKVVLFSPISSCIETPYNTCSSNEVFHSKLTKLSYLTLEQISFSMIFLNGFSKDLCSFNHTYTFLIKKGQEISKKMLVERLVHHFLSKLRCLQ